MKSKDDEENFSPWEVPGEWVKVLKFSGKVDGYFSEGFEWEVNDKSGLSTWSEQAAFPECFYSTG